MHINKVLVEHNISVALLKGHEFIETNKILLDQNYNPESYNYIYYYCKICNIILYIPTTLYVIYIVTDGTNKAKGWDNLVSLSFGETDVNDYTKLLSCNEYIIKNIIE